MLIVVHTYPTPCNRAFLQTFIVQSSVDNLTARNVMQPYEKNIQRELLSLRKTCKYLFGSPSFSFEIIISLRSSNSNFLRIFLTM